MKHLIAIGGNEDKANELIVLKRIIKELNKDDFMVGLITTASQEAAKVAKTYTKVFKSLLASRVEVLNIVERDQANDSSYVKTIEEMDLIFFSGGDQLRLTSILGGTSFLKAIEKHLRSGKVVAGTSAGAAAFSDTMIYDGKGEEGLLKGKVSTTPGFGFIENIIFDTHFLTRGRMGRLIQVVASNPTCIGIGLGEDSAIVLNGGKTIEVFGSGQVTIIDGGDIIHSNIMSIEPGKPIAFENIRVHSLVEGYRYDLDEKSFRRPLTK